MQERNIFKLMGGLYRPLFYCYNNYKDTFIMSEDFCRIASALERIAESLEKKWHIDIDHGHIEKIDNIEHGDIDTHAHSF